MINSFIKSHGLGNDYIVLNSEDISFPITPESIKRICDVHYGIGSDGILLKTTVENADFGLRIYNPDGSEAEKSGNGLRIFAKYLYDYQFAVKKDFSISTPGGLVHAYIVEETNKKAHRIKVEMGKAIFNPEDIPVTCDSDVCFDESLTVGGKTYSINCVSVGNPHCVIIKDELDIDEIMKYGSMIENAPVFPNRINVQFAKPVSRNEVDILIWERGAGYTLASGSSSCAVASVAIKKGLTDRKIKMNMPGGVLEIEIDEEWNILMTGEVQEIASGTLSNELINSFQNSE